MGDLLKTIGTILGLIAGGSAIIGGIILGVLYVLGLWKKGKNDEDDRLISVQKQLVDALELKVDKQKEEHNQTIGDLTKKIDDLTAKVDHLETENKTLRDILQGRDEQTQKFYIKAFESMELAAKTHELIKEMGKTQTDLMRVLVDNLKPNKEMGKTQVVVNTTTPPPPSPTA